MQIRSAVLGLIALLAYGCAGTETYTVVDFADKTAAHDTVAIVPFDVRVDMREVPEGLTQDDLDEQEQDEAYAFQRQIYNQFLQRYARGEYSVQFQDVDTTNVLLTRADIGYEDINTSYTKNELAEALGVDSIISGAITRNQPMGNVAAIATTALFGYGSGRTNEVNVSIALHDGADSALLWSYDHEVAGGLGSSPEGLAESLMRSVARQFPYRSDN